MIYIGHLSHYPYFAHLSLCSCSSTTHLGIRLYTKSTIIRVTTSRKLYSTEWFVKFPTCRVKDCGAALLYYIFKFSWKKICRSELKLLADREFSNIGTCDNVRGSVLSHSGVGHYQENANWIVEVPWITLGVTAAIQTGILKVKMTSHHLSG